MKIYNDNGSLINLDGFYRFDVIQVDTNDESFANFDAQDNGKFVPRGIINDYVGSWLFMSLASDGELAAEAKLVDLLTG